MDAIDTALSENKEKAEKKVKPKHQKQADAFLDEMKKFEADRVDMAFKSKKTAWMIAGGASVMAILLAIALVVLMPLKTVDYRLLTVDQDTGIVDIVPTLSDAQNITYGEALDRHLLHRWVVTRNEYQWQTVQDSFDYISMSSSNSVFSAYNSYIRADSSPVTVFADNKMIKISDYVASFLPTKQNQMLAQASFTKQVVNADGTIDTTYKPTRWTATLTFDYLADIKKPEERLLNPLAFRVTSYSESKVIR